ncbi:hypothetical protein E2C01_041541 [Portunus trituberculatus]|uniref:Uncharacterized protein n=1 Tax=Portunus trituberculatus TaxID=210409 RepID=A0A5B7FTU5_PORTR|nr:hypothetical protein [Portunus trituberculatus]
MQKTPSQPTPAHPSPPQLTPAHPSSPQPIPAHPSHPPAHPSPSYLLAALQGINTPSNTF